LVQLCSFFVKIESHYNFTTMATLIPLAVVAIAGPAIIALIFYKR